MPRRLAALLVVTVLVGACQSGTPQLTVASVQASEPVSGSAQVALTITNDGDGDDELVAVETDAAIGIEIHETVVDDGQAVMERRDAVTVPAGGSVSFRPGGLHLMMIAPDDDVALGGTFPITLQFDRSEPITVEAEVVDLLDLSESAFEESDDGA